MEASASQFYHVNERDGKFEVLNASGNVVLICGDDASATNYVLLLTEAYQRGYKDGYHDGRKSGVRNR